MPNAKVLSEKQAIVAGLAEKMKSASAGILVDYKGITVELDTKLRSMLRENNVEYAVVKNTLTRFAAKEIGLGELDPVLNGTTAIAMSHEDPILPARLITEFSKKNKTLAVKAGFVEGSVVSAAQIDSLAGMVSKPALLSCVLGTLNAPIAALARVLNAIAEQQGGTPAEAPAE